jgi:hypothetical protein
MYTSSGVRNLDLLHHVLHTIELVIDADEVPSFAQRR